VFRQVYSEISPALVLRLRLNRPLDQQHSSQ
jgi:hypothetical protein